MWLRETTLGSTLPFELREMIASGCKMIQIGSGSVLSAQVLSRNPSSSSSQPPPPYVYIVLSGMLKQRCKRRRFELYLTSGDSACELPLLDRCFADDVVTVVGGPSGASVISIPRKLYSDTARSERRRVVLQRVSALLKTSIFDGANQTQLGRLALGAVTLQIQVSFLNS
jgi:hypothetical protein